MNLKYIFETAHDLIRRDYRVPVFQPINSDLGVDYANRMSTSDSIPLREVLLPILQQLDEKERRERCLLEWVNFLTSAGCQFTYMSNPKKQYIIDQIRAVVPEVMDPNYYPKASCSVEGK